MSDKPTVPEVLPLVHDLYRSDHGTVGGCLHTVLDDGNIEDESVRWSLEHAEKEGCEPCTKIAKLLLRMSRTQRKKISHRAYEMLSDNVILWPKTRGPDMTCAKCRRPITKGQEYAMVRVPDGGLASVHGECIAERKTTNGD